MASGGTDPAVGLQRPLVRPQMGGGRLWRQRAGDGARNWSAFFAALGVIEEIKKPLWLQGLSVR